MAMMLNLTLLEKAIRAQITVAVHSIVRVSRKSDGPVAGISIMRALETTTI